MFSKKPGQNSPRPTTRPMANHGATFSVIGADIAIRGDIDAQTDLHVDGTVTGDLTCATLVQGEGSVIEGAIVAESARLSGKVKGTIEARALVVLKSARIEGDVSYETLTIEQGAVVAGRFQLRDRREAPAAPAPATSENDSKEPKLTLAR